MAWRPPGPPRECSCVTRAPRAAGPGGQRFVQRRPAPRSEQPERALEPGRPGPGPRGQMPRSAHKPPTKRWLPSICSLLMGAPLPALLSGWALNLGSTFSSERAVGPNWRNFSPKAPSHLADKLTQTGCCLPGLGEPRSLRPHSNGPPF